MNPAFKDAAPAVVAGGETDAARAAKAAAVAEAVPALVHLVHCLQQDAVRALKAQKPSTFGYNVAKEIPEPVSKSKPAAQTKAAPRAKPAPQIKQVYPNPKFPVVYVVALTCLTRPPSSVARDVVGNPCAHLVCMVRWRRQHGRRPLQIPTVGPAAAKKKNKLSPASQAESATAAMKRAAALRQAVQALGPTPPRGAPGPSRQAVQAIGPTPPRGAPGPSPPRPATTVPAYAPGPSPKAANIPPPDGRKRAATVQLQAGPVLPKKKKPFKPAEKHMDPVRCHRLYGASRPQGLFRARGCGLCETSMYG
jgi:hypothetical protein